MPLSPSTRLGQYEVLEAIGAGGMGEVYRAHDTKLGRDVAIKVLPEELSRDKERLDRFEREARLLAKLNHPNILAKLGQAHAGMGRRTGAIEVLAELTRISERAYVDGYHFATVHLALGDHEKAIDALEQAFDEHSASVGFLKVDPALDPLPRRAPVRGPPSPDEFSRIGAGAWLNLSHTGDYTLGGHHSLDT